MLKLNAVTHLQFFGSLGFVGLGTTIWGLGLVKSVSGCGLVPQESIKISTQSFTEIFELASSSSSIYLVQILPPIIVWECVTTHRYSRLLNQKSFITPL